MMEAEIRKIAFDLGIDLIGFFSVEPLVECLPYLIKRYEAGLITGFEGGQPKDRINYQHFFQNAKSGIVIGVSSYQKLKKPSDDKKRADLASVSWGEDYHVVLRNLINHLMEKINENLTAQRKPTVTYKAFVDNSPLIDRGSAYRAGLGFFGKNNLLISQTLGSYFFIGQVLLDVEIAFNPAQKISNGCGDCRRCLDACPYQALGEGYTLDPSRCISYITQKKTLSTDEEKRVKTYLYGCDLCQKVCPYNKDLKKTSERRFWTSPELAYPDIEDILVMTNKIFKERFGKTAAGWRGKKTIVRNAQLIEKNEKKND
ncbi:tRNA epoxyqueuosine(34) reductase QueG [Acetobacterium tundrae]|uniref:tRNA epoxyqueuosine(34) reductase QueG n=1 Tax=Acetobacterium tundrae TaxID=132932 RepID=A0ABR6WG73_9FIRM|nr:tRNA epoxyqueuosine(34) reductase QueG [Acetobacterium tundrae]MBC3795516.1 tRNA epoxyqueuosine(34) reductase QueG [Acetobacterium tundrae]